MGVVVDGASRLFWLVWSQGECEECARSVSCLACLTVGRRGIASSVLGYSGVVGFLLGDFGNSASERAIVFRYLLSVD